MNEISAQKERAENALRSNPEYERETDARAIGMAMGDLDYLAGVWGVEPIRETVEAGDMSTSDGLGGDPSTVMPLSRDEQQRRLAVHGVPGGPVPELIETADGKGFDGEWRIYDRGEAAASGPMFRYWVIDRVGVTRAHFLNESDAKHYVAIRSAAVA